MLSSLGRQAHSLRSQGGATARTAAASACWHAHGLRPLLPWPCKRPRMACMASSAASHYEVLGLDAQSSDDEIKTAFRQAAKRLHPDVNKEPGAEKRFIRINEAYATLSDPQRRRQYDAQLRATAASRATTSRAGTRSASSSGWVEYAWVVDFDDDSDDEDDEDVMEFFRWSTSGQNMRSSYQSSWQANAKKRQARQAATQAQQGGAQRQQGSQQRTAGQRRQEVTEADRAEILGSLRTDARQYAQKIFGRRLENLETWKQLDEFVDALEAMHLQEMDLHSFDSDDELFDSDDDEEDGWVRSPPRRGTNGASSSSQQAAPGARKSKTWQGDVDWETFVADFDTGSASSSKARQRQPSSPFSASSRGAAATAGAATGSRGSAPGRGTRQPAMPKMKSPPKRKSVVDDDDDDDDLNMDELEQLLSILVDTEDVGTGRKRAASRRPRGRRQ